MKGKIGELLNRKGITLLLYLSALIPLIIFVTSILAPSTEYDQVSVPVLHTTTIRFAQWAALLLGIILSLLVRWQFSQTDAGLKVNTGSSNENLSARIGYAIVGLFCLYLGLFYQSAYHSFYLQEHDFLNIAAALPHSGLLETPYVNTGPTGSFLGHHFSPFLLLLKPVFWVFSLMPRADYSTYMLPLYLGACLGVYLWYRAGILYIRKTHAWLLPVLACFLVCNPLILRLSLSFHFEVFVLPLSAACLLLRSSRWYWLSLLLLLMVKEDIALYVFLLSGSFFLFNWRANRSEPGLQGGSPAFNPANLRRLKFTTIASGIYLLLAILSQRTLAGGTGADWSHYWLEAFEWKGTQSTGFLLIFLAGGWMALVQSRLTLPLILILILHALSRHPWHNSFQSHYVYSVLPIILIGVFFLGTRGFVLLLPLMLFAGLLDRSTPLPLLEKRSYDTLHILNQIESNSCVRSSRHISVRIPLSSRPFPLYPIEGNPMASTDLCQPPPEEGCQRMYLLLESQDTPRLHGCQVQELRFRANTEHLNLFEYVQPGN